MAVFKRPLYQVRCVQPFEYEFEGQIKLLQMQLEKMYYSLSQNKKTFTAFLI